MVCIERKKKHHSTFFDRATALKELDETAGLSSSASVDMRFFTDGAQIRVRICELIRFYAVTSTHHSVNCGLESYLKGGEKSDNFVPGRYHKHQVQNRKEMKWEESE